MNRTTNRRRWIGIALASVLALAAWGVPAFTAGAADEPAPPPEAPAAEAAPAGEAAPEADAPAAEAAPDDDAPSAAEAEEGDGPVAQEAETQEEKAAKARAAIERARARAAELYYEVRLTFKDFQPTEVRESSEHFGYGRANDLGMQFSLDKRTLELDAVLVDPAEGLFVMGDPEINFDTVASMEMVGKDGKTYPLKRTAVGAHMQAVLLKAEGFRADVAAPEFRADVVKEGASIMLARPTSFREHRDVEVQGMRLERFLAAGEDLVLFNLAGLAPNVVQSWPVVTVQMFDKDGAFVGIAVSDVLVIQDGARNFLDSWSPTEGWLSVEQLSAVETRARAGVERHIVRARFQFRQEGASRRPVNVSNPANEGSEWITYGLVVGPHDVFIPFGLNLPRIESIESILVRAGEQDAETPGEFVGLYKEFGGMLLRTERAFEAPPDLWGNDGPGDGALFVDVSVKQRRGAKDALFKYNRFFGTDKGYKDMEFRSPERPLLGGAFSLDAEGRFYAFAAVEMRYETVATAAAVRALGVKVRCYPLAEMKERFTDPAEYFDPRARVRDIEESKKLAWLGVEFQPVTPELARQLGIEAETRDGREGLLLNVVYDGSPAARMGMRVGDVLLKITIVGRGEIALRLAPTYGMPRGFGGGGGDGSAPFVDRSWFNRVNPLTNLLTIVVGVGQKAVITYSQDHDVKSKEFTVEEAPPDLRSAPKHKSDWTGLTLKEVTYEVRHLLRLADEFQGVIVYEVDAGSAAAVGRISPMEFIVEVDGKPAGNAAALAGLLDVLGRRGRESVTLKVQSLDESRFVQLQLEEPEADDGGDGGGE